jgi:hypothetical protein
MSGLALYSSSDEQKDYAAALAVRLEAIQMDRSAFALAHFVVGQHDTAPRMWSQAILELQIKLENLRALELDADGLALDVEEAEARTGCEGMDAQRAVIDGKRAALALGALGLRALSLRREAAALYAIIMKIEEANGGRPYTFEELQNAEADYWILRLERQARYDVMASGRIGPGNMEAIEQRDRINLPFEDGDAIKAALKISPPNNPATLKGG